MWKVTSAEFVRSAYDESDFLRDGRTELAFVGRSNVGKSSLINRLLGRKGLARTSSKPGRTRAVNYFLINRKFYLVDLPGYGWAKRSKRERQQWAAIVDRYFAQADSPMVVLLIDGKVGGTSLDVQAVEYLKELGVGLTIAVTKIDRIPRYKRSQTLAHVSELLQIPEGIPILAVSAKTGEGITELSKNLSLTR